MALTREDNRLALSGISSGHFLPVFLAPPLVQCSWAGAVEWRIRTFVCSWLGETTIWPRRQESDRYVGELQNPRGIDFLGVFIFSIMIIWLRGLVREFFSWMFPRMVYWLWHCWDCEMRLDLNRETGFDWSMSGSVSNRDWCCGDYGGFRFCPVAQCFYYREFNEEESVGFVFQRWWFFSMLLLECNGTFFWVIYKKLVLNRFLFWKFIINNYGNYFWNISSFCFLGTAWRTYFIIFCLRLYICLLPFYWFLNFK